MKKNTTPKTVYYIAKDGKTIQKATVVGQSYNIVLPGGQRSYVDVEHCASSPTALVKNLNAAIKERICLAYFKAVDNLAKAKTEAMELFPISEVEVKQ